jgi:AbrB family looped-hinge helix DNA binding protein
MVSIDGRGQIVLPKDIRDKAGLEAGDKLAVIAFENDGQVCCISLVKANAFADTVKDMLGPMMSEILQD